MLSRWTPSIPLLVAVLFPLEETQLRLPLALLALQEQTHWQGQRPSEVTHLALMSQKEEWRCVQGVK